MLYNNDKSQNILSTEIDVQEQVLEDIDSCDESVSVSDDIVNRLNSFNIKAINQQSFHLT